MSDVEITATVDLSAFNRAMAGIADGVEFMDSGPMAEAMKGVADEYMFAIRERFQQQSQGGGAWRRNKDSTIKAWYYKHGGGVGGKRGKLAAKISALQKPILVDDGDLYRSLIRGGANYYEIPFADGIVVGTEDPHAAYNHYGTRRIPARPILVALDDPTLSSQTSLAIQAQLTDGLSNVIQQSTQT